MFLNPPEISVVVPLLNEALELPGLFASLSAQESVTFEVIFCDGGSNDGSQELCRKLGSSATFTVSTINAPRGRARQMNAGAGIAASELLLFLHADSRFARPDALLTAVSSYRETCRASTSPVAARFRLRFRRTDARPSLAYHFYESKAQLDRADCIRGDQGFMLSRDLFHQLGKFDDSLAFLEDVRLASAVAEAGNWLLLPAEISTSARRFETEGLYERQVVNAIITNAIAAGWTEFFIALPGLYRCSSVSGRLQIFPLLDGIRALLAAQPAAWQRAFWRATGRHVAGNIWQIFFWWDVRTSFMGGGRTDDIPTHRLLWFQRHLERRTRGPLAEWITAAAVWIWFRCLLVRYGWFTKTS